MLPKVVIIGRPNVGKSSLLNLLAGRLVSIVDPTAGVTRDRVSTVIDLPSQSPGEKTRQVELIDTGGYGIRYAEDLELSAQIGQQIAVGVAEADMVLFVIDAQAGVTPLDEEVGHMLRSARGRGKVPVVIVANKVDSSSHEAGAYEATSLGFGAPLLVSALAGTNKFELQQAIHDQIDFTRAGREDEAGPLLAIVGKRNAGKSTLVNALAGQERVIVNEIEGTTRDAVDVRFVVEGRPFTAIDTAGVRKRKSLAGDIEFYSYHRALRSVRRSDVVLLLIDATIPVSGVDKQLGMHVQKHYKPTVIVVNKWDLAEAKHTQEEYVEYLDKALKGLDYAPVAFVSAMKGEGVRDVVAMALNLYYQAGHRVQTAELNKTMEQLLSEKTPVSGIGRKPKIYYATQLAVHPPTIGLFVNDPSMFDANYQRFLINRFRDLLPFSEVPIKLIVRGRRKSPAERPAGA